MHWALKRSLATSGGDLCSCWEQMHGMLEGQIGKIISSFQESITRIDAEHNTPFYKSLQGLVSRAALDNIHGELMSLLDQGIGDDKKRCGCTIWVTHGLPYSCELSVFHLGGLPIPLDLVDIHWRRLTLDCMDEEQVKKASIDCDLTYTIEEVYRQWGDMSLEERCVWKRGLDEYVYKHTTNMVPPKYKVKTRGAPKKEKKKKKEYDAKRDPSYWEHVDASLEPTQESVKKSSQKSVKKSSQKTPTLRSTKELSQVFKSAFKQPIQHDMQYLSHFPEPVRRFVDDIMDVKGDGNCDFRCISGLLHWGQDSWQKVRNDLTEEFDINWHLYSDVMGDQIHTVRNSLVTLTDASQPIEKWMVMPHTGHLIATRYQ